MNRALTLALLPVLILPSCMAMFGGLNSMDEKRLKEYQRRAGKYFDRASIANQPAYYDRSLDQCQRGLQIDPDDYMLRQTQAWCYLKMAQWDRNRLLMAEEKFQELLPERDPKHHDPRTLLGYGLTLHQLAVVQNQMADAADSEAKRVQEASAGGKAPAKRAKEHRERAKVYLDNAERQLTVLLTINDYPVLVHRHLMNVCELQGNTVAAKEHGMKALKLIDNDRKYWERKFNATYEPGYEKEIRKAVEELDVHETQIRTTLGLLYYRDKQYDKELEQLNRLLEMNPNVPVNYYNRGACYRALGRVTDARKDFKKFLSTHSLAENHEKVTDAFRYTYGHR